VLVFYFGVIVSLINILELDTLKKKENYIPEFAPVQRVKNSKMEVGIQT
jgi:hypothetical protein